MIYITPMTATEIKAAVTAALEAAGIPIARSNYLDMPCVCAVYPETKWVDEECLICIFEDRVQKFQRNCPMNYSKGFMLGNAIPYSTPSEMVAAVRSLRDTPKAACWA